MRYKRSESPNLMEITSYLAAFFEKQYSCNYLRHINYTYPIDSFDISSLFDEQYSCNCLPHIKYTNVIRILTVKIEEGTSTSLIIVS